MVQLGAEPKELEPVKLPNRSSFAKYLEIEQKYLVPIALLKKLFPEILEKSERLLIRQIYLKKSEADWAHNLAKRYGHNIHIVDQTEQFRLRKTVSLNAETKYELTLKSAKFDPSGRIIKGDEAARIELTVPLTKQEYKEALATRKIKGQLTKLRLAYTNCFCGTKLEFDIPLSGGENGKKVGKTVLINTEIDASSLNGWIIMEREFSSTQDYVVNKGLPEFLRPIAESIIDLADLQYQDLASRITNSKMARNGVGEYLLSELNALSTITGPLLPLPQKPETAIPLLNF